LQQECCFELASKGARVCDGQKTLLMLKMGLTSLSSMLTVLSPESEVQTSSTFLLVLGVSVDHLQGIWAIGRV